MIVYIGLFYKDLLW